VVLQNRSNRSIAGVVGTLVVALTLTSCGGITADDYSVASNNTELQDANQPMASGYADDGSAQTSTKKTATKTVAKKPAGLTTDELIATKVPGMGNVVTDAKHWILYRFDKDSANPSKSACTGTCAEVWPPLLTDGGPELTNIHGKAVATIRRADGGLQVTIGGWPVYRYIGDKQPGTWKGQNVGGVWFVVSKTGKKNLTCLPPVSKAVAPPSAKAKAAATSTDSSANSTDSPTDTSDGTNYGTGY
jgi:predicted lipoprotein with Yx(FWY)xxD motif